MLSTLDHVVIAVRDLEAATGRYAQLLGRRPSWRGAHAAYGTENTLFRLDNSYLELLAPAGEGAVATQLRDALASEGEGPAMLAFGTEDADALARTLRERGLAVSGPTPGEGRDAQTGAVRRWRNVFLPGSETRGVRVFAIEHLSPAEALPPAEPTGAPAQIVSGVDHVVITTADPEAAIELYGAKLGLRLALDRRFEKRALRLLFFRIGGITLEVAASLGDGPGKGPGAADSGDPDRFWGIAYRVGDVDAACSRLRAEGVDVGEPRAGHKPGTRVCSVTSETHGVPTLFIGPAPDEA